MSTFRQKVQATTDWGKPDPEEAAGVRGKKAGKRAGKQSGPKQSGPKRLPAQPPVTSHRLFPALAALWFAALFGLGSLAISSEVLGKLVMAAGLPALVPAAAPPLGFTAHVLLALALTVVGASVGLVLGMRLRPRAAKAAFDARPAPVVATNDEAGAPKVRARDAHPDAPPRRPLVLTEAFADPAGPLVDETIVPAIPSARRLSGSEASGTEVSGSGVAAPATWIPVDTPGGAGASEPLDLAVLDCAELDADAPDPAAGAFPASDFVLGLAPAATEAEPVAVAADEATSGAAADVGRPVLLAATPQIPSGFAFPLPGSEQLAVGETWSPVAKAPLESLGLVQLIERLALAIAARKVPGDSGPPPSAESPAPEDECLAAEMPLRETIGDEVLESTVSEASDAASDAAELVPDVLVTDPDAPFAKPAGPAPAAAAGPAGSARDAILRRLGATPAPVHVDPVVDAGPGPFSRPQPASSASSPLMPSVTAPVSAFAPHDKSPESGPETGPAADPETNEALRSALATLQRMSARG